MQHLEVSAAVRPLKWSLGVRWLNNEKYMQVSREMRVILSLCT